MKRQQVLVGIVVLLAGVAAYVWATREGTEVDPQLQVKFNYTCIHCQHSFEMTAADEAIMKRNNGGVVCPNCGKTQEPDEARTDSGTFREIPVPENEEPPPQVEGGLKKRGG